MTVSIFTHKFEDSRTDTKVAIMLFNLSKPEARAEAKLQILNEYPNWVYTTIHPNKVMSHLQQQ